MRRSSATALAWLFFANALAAQQRDSATNPVPNQTVYVEIGGNAGLLSMNYDRKLNERFTARIGYGKWATFRSFPAGDQENDYGRFVPVMINFLSRSAPGSRNWIEVGAGMVFGEWWSEVEQNPHHRVRAALSPLATGGWGDTASYVWEAQSCCHSFLIFL
jgi:hypothetical protein